MFEYHNFIKLAFLVVTLLPTALQGATTIEAESMTVGGPYAGVISTPFAGVAFFGNGDIASQQVTISDAPGRYTFSLRGASSNASAATVTVLIDASPVGSVTWANATVATSTLLQVDLTASGNHVVAFRMDTDTGASDAYVDWISWTRAGSIPPPPAPPVPATVGALTSGVWRNLFAEAGHATVDIDAKVAAAWQQLFYGNGTSQRIYYPVGTDKAYILDTGNNDVRSEGMSYGMMISVQLDKQEEFDRLWRWATTYMRNPAGEREGYFAWQ